MAARFQCITLAFIFHMLHHKDCETSPADNQFVIPFKKYLL